MIVICCVLYTKTRVESNVVIFLRRSSVQTEIDELTTAGVGDGCDVTKFIRSTSVAAAAAAAPPTKQYKWSSTKPTAAQESVDMKVFASPASNE